MEQNTIIDFHFVSLPTSNGLCTAISGSSKSQKKKKKKKKKKP